MKQIYKRWLGLTEEPDLKKQLLLMTEPEINDAFYKDLEFGAVGLRGLTGAGTNRMNIYTVNRATQGLCDFLKRIAKNPSVAIAFDSRTKSEQFARLAAGVLAANGVKTYIFSQMMPAPVLSYAVKAFECDAGIMITANNNPAEYNVYRVYKSDGCQITPQIAYSIQKSIEMVDIFEGVKKETFEKAVQDGTIRFISQELLKKYLDRVEQCFINPDILKGSDLTSELYSAYNL